MRTLATFTGIVWLALTGFSQGKAVTEAKYEESLKRAGEAIYKAPYRVKQVTEECSGTNCIWQPLYQSILEVVPGGGRRSMFIDTRRGNKEPSSVWIFIGDQTFVNRRNSGWTVETPAKDSQTVYPKTEILSVEYRDLGTSSLNGKNFGMFQKVTKSRLTNEGRVSDNIQTVTTWIDSDGKLFRQEFVSTNSSRGSTRLDLTYESDPTIVIEAPIK